MKKFTHIKNGKELMVAAKDGRKNKRIKSDLEYLISVIDSFTKHTSDYNGCYFWKGDFGNGSERLRREEEAEYKDSFKSEKIDLVLELNFDIEMSRRNVYTYKKIYVNEDRKTARALTTIIKEAEAILAQIPSKKEV